MHIILLVQSPLITTFQNHSILLESLGIVSVWLEGNPCNMHLLDLSGSVKEGVEKSGLTGFRFNTIGVSDGRRCAAS